MLAPATTVVPPLSLFTVIEPAETEPAISRIIAKASEMIRNVQVADLQIDDQTVRLR